MSQHGARRLREIELRGWPGLAKRLAATLAVLTVAMAPAGCGEAIVASGNRAASKDASADVGQEVCLVGRPTGEGVECQAFRTDDGRLYTLIGDLGSLAGVRDVCICGVPVEMSTCMQGTTVTVTRIGPPDTCP